MSTDKAFCLTCIAFGGPSTSDLWACHGWNDWRNGIRAFDLHETSKAHKASEKARFHWLTGRSMAQVSLKPNNVVVEENRKVVSCVIDSMKYLAQEMMALRGRDAAGGKLMNLFRLMSKYQPAAAAYLERIENCKQEKRRMSTNYLSANNAQQLLSVMRRLILEQVIKRFEYHKRCSIIADGTYDSSKKEATVLL